MISDAPELSFSTETPLFEIPKNLYDEILIALDNKTGQILKDINVNVFVVDYSFEFQRFLILILIALIIVTNKKIIFHLIINNF